MIISKKDIIINAYAAVGLAEYVYDISPELMKMALVRLDALAASLEPICAVRYLLPNALDQSNEDTQMNVNDSAIDYLFLELGSRLAVSLGVDIIQNLVAQKSMAYHNMLMACSDIPRAPLDRRANLGAGNESPNFISRVFIDS